MENLISKKLLSEVLGYEPFKIDKIKQVDGVGLTLVLINQDGTVRSYQNIYQLAHKCKEWAFDNGYYLTIYNDAVDIILQSNCKIVENITDGSFKYSPALVFKACEHIRRELLK